AAAKPLTDDEQQITRQQWDELTYLLTLQDWQQEPSRRVAEAVRQRLGFLRRASGLQAQQVAKALSVRKNSVLAIENEGSTTKRVTADKLSDEIRRNALMIDAKFMDSDIATEKVLAYATKQAQKVSQPGPHAF